MLYREILLKFLIYCNEFAGCPVFSLTLNDHFQMAILNAQTMQLNFRKNKTKERKSAALSNFHWTQETNKTKNENVLVFNISAACFKGSNGQKHFRGISQNTNVFIFKNVLCFGK